MILPPPSYVETYVPVIGPALHPHLGALSLSTVRPQRGIDRHQVPEEIALDTAPRERLEQPYHPAIVRYIDLLRRGHLGQTGHRHHVTTDHDHEFGAGGKAYLAHIHDVPRGRAAHARVGGERRLGLGDAHGVVPVARLLQLLHAVTHSGVGGHVRRPVDADRNLLHLIPQRLA